MNLLRLRWMGGEKLPARFVSKLRMPSKRSHYDGAKGIRRNLMPRLGEDPFLSLDSEFRSRTYSPVEDRRPTIADYVRIYTFHTYSSLLPSAVVSSHLS